MAEGQVMEQAAGSPGAQHRADGCRQHRGPCAPAAVYGAKRQEQCPCLLLSTWADVLHGQRVKGQGG